jgi:hypothetical protein
MSGSGQLSPPHCWLITNRIGLFGFGQPHCALGISGNGPWARGLPVDFEKQSSTPLPILHVWLVAYRRCWTVDRLRPRGLPHPRSVASCIKLLGISPNNLLDESPKDTSCLAFPISVGSCPSRLLKDKSIAIIDGILNISFGMLT